MLNAQVLPGNKWYYRRFRVTKDRLDCPSIEMHCPLPKRQACASLCGSGLFLEPRIFFGTLSGFFLTKPRTPSR